jgi:hypothetical protein
MEQKSAELIELYRKKSRDHSTTQKLYDTLKKKTQERQLQSIASENVAHAIETMNATRRPETLNGVLDNGPRYQQQARHGLDDRTNHSVGMSKRVVEQLHPYQRSGSSAVGSDQHNSMLPPERPGVSRTCE